MERYGYGYGRAVGASGERREHTARTGYVSLPSGNTMLQAGAADLMQSGRLGIPARIAFAALIVMRLSFQVPSQEIPGLQGGIEGPEPGLLLAQFQDSLDCFQWPKSLIEGCW